MGAADDMHCLLQGWSVSVAFPTVSYIDIRLRDRHRPPMIGAYNQRNEMLRVIEVALFSDSVFLIKLT